MNYATSAFAFASASPSTYAKFQAFNVSILGRIFLGGWLFCIYYHLCNGIRHLKWDTGHGLDLRSTYVTGWMVLAASGGLTLIAWIAGLAARG